MASCYLVAIAENSALDLYTNNWSLFKLTNSVQIDVRRIEGGEVTEDDIAAADIPVFLEFHCFLLFDADEVNTEFEFRMLFQDIPEEVEIPGHTFTMKPENKNQRIRLRNLNAPYFGKFRIFLEWRRQDDAQWHRSQAHWPLTISRKVSDTSNGEVSHAG